MKKLSIICLVLIMLVSLTACSQGEEGGAGQDAENYTISIVSGSASGTYYAIMSQMLNHLPKDIPGLVVSGLEGGSVENVRVVNKGRDAQIGFVWSSVFFEGLRGINAFEQDGKQENVQAIMNLYTRGIFYAVASEKSGIKSLAEVEGKRFAPGEIGIGLEYASKAMLANLGISYDSIKAKGGQVIHEKYGQYGSLMKDGLLDIFMLPAAPGIPHSVVLEVMNSMPVTFIPMEGEFIDKFVSEYGGYSKGELAPNVYEGQTEPVPGVIYYNTIIVNKDMPEDLVYKITKSCHENTDLWLKVVPDAERPFEDSQLLEGIDPATLHPGAARYWKEVGLLK